MRKKKNQQMERQNKECPNKKCQKKEKEPVICILAATHKTTNAPQNRYIRLIQAGAALAEKRLPHILHDDEGTHISHRNRSYCELTVQYYAWKNLRADYYGFFHYCRYMDFSKEDPHSLKKYPKPYTRIDSLHGRLSDYGLYEEKIRAVVEKYDVITVPGEYMDVTVYQQFGQFHDRRDLEQMIRILKKRQPAFAAACDYYMNSRNIYFCNMYLMRKEYFEPYMQWLFPLLEEFEQVKASSSYGKDQARMAGYLAERLFGVYYTWLKQKGGVRCCELPYVIFGKGPQIRQFYLWDQGPRLVIDMRKINLLLPACSLRRRLVRKIAGRILTGTKAHGQGDACIHPSEPQTDIQLQRILKPRPQICPVEELYYHRHGRRLLFDGYFNLFYIEKWKRYTDLERLYLSIETKGYEKLLLFHNRACIAAYRLDGSCAKACRAEFPLGQYDKGAFWFALTESEQAADREVSGFYMGACSRCMDTTIAVDMCTFHRESYVRRNLKLLETELLHNNKMQVSRQLWVLIVDNGRTLDACQPVTETVSRSGGRIRVIANRNAGGAGGFTRGMLEVLQEKEAKKLTHVLLMDDDVRIDPELFVRIYGFLRMRKEKWKDITLGGMMLLEEMQYLLFAAGESWNKGMIRNRNKGMDLRQFENAAGRELLTVRHENEYYCGWWCCCYSLNLVRADNLPLPLFLHHDDIEFGLRCRKAGIVFLNGVSVWHRNFALKPPGSNLYYDIRNALIEMALQDHRQAAARCIWQFYWKRLAVRLVRGSFDEAVLMIRGGRDFLKGPRWLWEQDPERLHQNIRKLPDLEKRRIFRSAGQICLRMYRQRWQAVDAYQEQMYQYATAQAWMEYLGLERDTGGSKSGYTKDFVSPDRKMYGAGAVFQNGTDG